MQGQYPAMNLEIVSQKFFFQFLKRNSNLTTVIKLGFEESWFLSTGHQNSSQQEKNCDSIHSAWRHLDTTESQVTLYVGCGLWVVGVCRWSLFVVGRCLSLVVVFRWLLFVVGRCLSLVVGRFLLLFVVCRCLSLIPLRKKIRLLVFDIFFFREGVKKREDILRSG